MSAVPDTGHVVYVKVQIGSAPSSRLNTSASGNASRQKSELGQRTLLPDLHRSVLFMTEATNLHRE